MLVHRRFQLRQREKNMVAIKSPITREPTHIFSVRVPESLYQKLKHRAEELEIPQNRLVLEGLQARLGESTDAASPDADRKTQA